MDLHGLFDDPYSRPYGEVVSCTTLPVISLILNCIRMTTDFDIMFASNSREGGLPLLPLTVGSLPRADKHPSR